MGINKKKKLKILEAIFLVAIAPHAQGKKIGKLVKKPTEPKKQYKNKRYTYTLEAKPPHLIKLDNTGVITSEAILKTADDIINTRVWEKSFAETIWGVASSLTHIKTRHLKAMIQTLESIYKTPVTVREEHIIVSTTVKVGLTFEVGEA